MKIVCLDGHTLNPGDLSWSGFEALGTFSVYNRTASAEVLPRCAGAEILLTNKTPLTRQTLDRLERLRYVGVLATGYNVVDVDCARERGVTVTNVPGYGAAAVAEAIFALIFELWRRTGLHAESTRNGDWCRAPDYCYWLTPQIELAGKTLGIVGLGRIGRRAAQIAAGFEMRVLACGPPGRPPRLETGAAGMNPTLNVEIVELEILLREADAVALCCPLTPDNRELINFQRLSLMKPGAILINTGRGGLVNEADLAAALNDGLIAGAGLDVLSTEPPAPDNPLLAAKNCLITPHLAWTTLEARRRLLHVAVENLRAFLAGTPQNVVNGQ